MSARPRVDIGRLSADRYVNGNKELEAEKEFRFFRFLNLSVLSVSSADQNQDFKGFLSTENTEDTELEPKNKKYDFFGFGIYRLLEEEVDP